ncbi:MerR family transcriptional regulator [Arthrobacter sp. 35W]|uniref:MerR family transcriptional regulator n=1 Tax=Arthrobacter sp. 35W TaxID=1132441 RepID=UPI0012DBF7B3|nr:MerR family transcriptional regulator [Arthrobacter sp. 35W]
MTGSGRVQGRGPGGLVDPANIPAGRGVYGITVAAELTATPVQTLRLFERRGLVDPARTTGGSRLYSRDDLARVVHINELLESGMNLAGAAAVLVLEAEVSSLKERGPQPRDAREERP